MTWEWRTYRADNTFWIRERGDDTTRIVTTYNQLGAVTGTRPFTAAEGAAADQAAATAAQGVVQTTLAADTAADLAKLTAAITALATLLADDTTVGSIRNAIGPAGAVAGTGSLRALKAQTNANVVLAASIKALIDRCIDLAQRQIDDSQATRRIARQTLRLAKILVGDYTTADVGVDIP